MTKSRFMVLRMKDIIRTGIIALVGLILLVVLIWAVLPRGGATVDAVFGTFVPGTYTSYIVIHNQPIAVYVTVDEESIVDITLGEMAETQAVFYPLIQPTMHTLAQQILSAQSTQIDAPTGAVMTSRILLDAVNSALAQAVNPN